MTNQDAHFNRQISFFGQRGQDKIKRTKVVIVGYGGLGTQVFMALCYLGVSQINIIEHETFSETNRNRYVGFYHTDVGCDKGDVAVRLANLINPAINVENIKNRLETTEAFEAIKAADVVFGCVDNDGPRSILNELCVGYKKILIDVASEISADSMVYGGRVLIVQDGQGCLHCMGDGLDQNEIRRYLTPDHQLENEASIYGVSVEELKGGSGPSVISINGQIANMAVTEFIALITGMRAPHRALIHRMNLQQITRPQKMYDTNCPCCQNFGEDGNINMHRYISLFE
jgi:molybdopterin/thiamine biosynthesis adenylyltransferase